MEQAPQDERTEAKMIESPMGISIVSVAATIGARARKAVAGARARALEEGLAQALGAEILPPLVGDEEDLDIWNGHIIALLYYDEGDEVDWRRLLDVYIYPLCDTALLGLPGRPRETYARLELEKALLCNVGRRPLSYAARETTENLVRELSREFGERAELSRLTIGCPPRDALFVLLDLGSTYQLPFLRVFRSDYGQDVFFATLDFFLFSAHYAYILACESVLGDILAGELIHRPSFSDGGIVDAARRLFRRVPGGEELPGIADGAARAFREVCAEFDLRPRGSPSYGLWDFLGLVVQLRNATKGHGIIYDVPDAACRAFTHTLLDFSARAVPAIASLVGQRVGGDRAFWLVLDRLRGARRGAEARLAKMAIEMPDGQVRHSAGALWMPGEGAFLFEGLGDETGDSEGAPMTYRNYASGRTVEIPREMIAGAAIPGEKADDAK